MIIAVNALGFAFAASWMVVTAMAVHLSRLLEATGASTVQAVAAGTLIVATAPLIATRDGAPAPTCEGPCWHPDRRLRGLGTDFLVRSQPRGPLAIFVLCALAGAPMNEVHWSATSMLGIQSVTCKAHIR
jgi:hypothetical protein